MAGVEGQRIRDTFARRGLSGRTFGAAFDPVLLAYGVLPITRLIVGVDFAGGSRLPANSGGGDRLKAKYGAGWPPRFGRGSVLAVGGSAEKGLGGRGGCLVEIALAQTGRVNEAQPDGYGLIQGRFGQRRLACSGL
jgi:hypothetical protein